MEDVFKKQIIDIVANLLKKSSADIDETQSFDTLGIDALDLFEMVLKLEDTFLIEISDDEFEKVASIPDVLTLVVSKNIKKETVK